MTELLLGEVRFRHAADPQCVLVVVGATKSGKKELGGVLNDFKDCEQRLHERPVIGLEVRGLTKPPGLVGGDAALGIWEFWGCASEGRTQHA